MERPVILTKARQWTLFGAGVVVGGLAVMTLVGLATFIGSGVDRICAVDNVGLASAARALTAHTFNRNRRVGHAKVAILINHLAVRADRR